MKRVISLLCVILIFLTAFSYTDSEKLIICKSYEEKYKSNNTEINNNIKHNIDKSVCLDNMRAVRITLGKDFYTDKSQSLKQTDKQIDDILNNLNTLMMNTIIIDIDYNNVSYYSLEPIMNIKEVVLKEFIDKAKQKQFNVYVNIDINKAISSCKGDKLNSKINTISQIAFKFVGEYLIDGMIIDGYYSSSDTESYKEYIKEGSGIGFSNWLYENNDYAFSLICNTIHKTNSRIPVGIVINNVWANKSSNSIGSDTNDSFQSLTDGYADTLKYIKNGYVDFIMLKTQGSTKDTEIPYASVAKWWGNVAKDYNVPLYTCNLNDKLNSKETGWESDDQIINQFTVLNGIPSFKGFVFNSYNSLLSNKVFTELLLKYIKEKSD